MSDAARDDTSRDADLLARLRAGDSVAFDTIYLRYYDRLLTFARRIANDMEPAADLVQDVFLSLWERRAQHRIVPPIAAYLYAAVRNRSRFAMRRTLTAERMTEQWTASHTAPGLGTFVSDPEERFEASAIRDALRAAILALPARQQLALRLRADDRLTPIEIAAALGIREQVVRRLLAKAMAKLSAVLRQAEEG